MPYGLFLHLANFHLLIHSKYEFDLISHANEHTYILEKQVYFTNLVHFDFKFRNMLYALTLRRSGLRLLMGKFRQKLRSFLPETRPYFRFQTIT